MDRPQAEDLIAYLLQTLALLLAASLAGTVFVKVISAGVAGVLSFHPLGWWGCWKLAWAAMCARFLVVLIFSLY